MVRISELRDRDVVNVNDGRRLGVISDVDLDTESGRITAIIIPGEGGFMGVIGKKHEIVLAWEQIVKVGVDTILVDYGEEEEKA